MTIQKNAPSFLFDRMGLFVKIIIAFPFLFVAVVLSLFVICLTFLKKKMECAQPTNKFDLPKPYRNVDYPDAVSPWASQAKVKSPDRSMTAEFSDAREFAFGSPHLGTITIYHSGKSTRLASLEEVCASFVWSDDSKSLAFTRISKFNTFTICIFNIIENHEDVIKGGFDVLELVSFKGGIVKGVASPLVNPKTVVCEIS